MRETLFPGLSTLTKWIATKWPLKFLRHRTNTTWRSSSTIVSCISPTTSMWTTPRTASLQPTCTRRLSCWKKHLSNSSKWITRRSRKLLDFPEFVCNSLTSRSIGSRLSNHFSVPERCKHQRLVRHMFRSKLEKFYFNNTNRCGIQMDAVWSFYTLLCSTASSTYFLEHVLRRIGLLQLPT